MIESWRTEHRVLSYAAFKVLDANNKFGVILRVKNGAVYTTIISTNANKDKLIIMYQFVYCAEVFRYMFRPSRGHHQAYLQKFSLSS
jgi:hypothetical protein